MDTKDLERLRGSIDKRAVLHFSDGEKVIAEIITVSEEDREVVYDVVSSSRREAYENVQGKPAYLVSFDDIVSVEHVP